VGPGLGVDGHGPRERRRRSRAARRAYANIVRRPLRAHTCISLIADTRTSTCRQPLHDASVQLLRDIRSFFTTTFKILPVPTSSLSSSDAGSDDDDDEMASGAPAFEKGREYIFSCMGTGYTNTNKSVT
jgi:hypothetical protein